MDRQRQRGEAEPRYHRRAIARGVERQRAHRRWRGDQLGNAERQQHRLSCRLALPQLLRPDAIRGCVDELRPYHALRSDVHALPWDCDVDAWTIRLRLHLHPPVSLHAPDACSKRLNSPHITASACCKRGLICNCSRAS